VAIVARRARPVTPSAICTPASTQAETIGPRPPKHRRRLFCALLVPGWDRSDGGVAMPCPASPPHATMGHRLQKDPAFCIVIYEGQP
jgi:hypothetical protein